MNVALAATTSAAPAAVVRVLSRQPSSVERAGLIRGTVEFSTWLPRAGTEHGVPVSLFCSPALALPPAFCKASGPVVRGVATAENPRQVFRAYAPKNKKCEFVPVRARFRILPSHHEQNLSQRCADWGHAERIASLHLEMLKVSLRDDLLESLHKRLDAARGGSDLKLLRALSVEELLVRRPFLIGWLFDKYPWLMLVSGRQVRGLGCVKYMYMRGDLSRLIFAEVR